MGWRGRCHDDTAVESFFHVLTQELIRQRTYTSREGSRQKVFDCIEMSTNPHSKRVHDGLLSPDDFKRQHVGYSAVAQSAGYSVSDLNRAPPKQTGNCCADLAIDNAAYR